MTFNNLLKERLGFSNFRGFDALLLCVWTLPVLMYNLRGFLYRLVGEFGADIFLPFVFTICILFSFKYIINNTKAIDYIFYFICVAYYFFCYNYYTANAHILKELSDVFLLQSLPVFFVGLCIDIDKSFNLLRTLSIICIILKAFSILIFGGIGESGASSEEMEAMSASHNILPYCLFLVWSAFRDGGVKNWIIATFSIILMLSLGNRGSLFALLMFVVLYGLFFKNYKRPVRSRILIACMGAIGYLMIKPIILISMGIFAAMGMSTRIFAKILADDIADDNGRKMITENMMEHIHQGSFWGYGLAGDRMANSGFGLIISL